MAEPYASSLTRLVRGLTADHPQPPRPVTYRDVLAAVSRSSVGFAGYVFGVVMLIAGYGFLVGAKGQGWAIVTGAFFLLFGLVLVAFPLWYARRVEGALRFGVVSLARVTALTTREGPGRRSLDAMANGYVEGRRLVQHPLGEFEAAFKFDGPGASSLRIGSSMPVLIDPSRRRVLLDVG